MEFHRKFRRFIVEIHGKIWKDFEIFQMRIAGSRSESYCKISRWNFTEKIPTVSRSFLVAKSSHLIVLLSRSVCVYGELGLACLDWRDLFARKFISTTSVYLFRSSDVRTSKCVEACKRFVSSCLFWLLARTCDLTVKVRHSKTFQLFATSISLPLFHPSSHRNSPFICKNHSRFLNPIDRNLCHPSDWFVSSP